MDENKIQHIHLESHDRESGEPEGAVAQENVRSARELTGQLSRDVIRLISREMDLAKTELREKADEAENGIKSFLIGAGVIIPGAFVAIAAVVLLLSTFMAPWIAAAIVAIAIFVTGFALIGTARQKLKIENIKPEATISSLRADRRTAKEVWNGRRKIG